MVTPLSRSLARLLALGLFASPVLAQHPVPGPCPSLELETSPEASRVDVGIEAVHTGSTSSADGTFVMTTEFRSRIAGPTGSFRPRFLLEYRMPIPGRHAVACGGPYDLPGGTRTFQAHNLIPARGRPLPSGEFSIKALTFLERDGVRYHDRSNAPPFENVAIGRVVTSRDITIALQEVAGQPDGRVDVTLVLRNSGRVPTGRFQMRIDPDQGAGLPPLESLEPGEELELEYTFHRPGAFLRFEAWGKDRLLGELEYTFGDVALADGMDLAARTDSVVQDAGLVTLTARVANVGKSYPDGPHGAPGPGVPARWSVEGVDADLLETYEDILRGRVALPRPGEESVAIAHLDLREQDPAFLPEEIRVHFRVSHPDDGDDSNDAATFVLRPAEIFGAVEPTPPRIALGESGIDRLHTPEVHGEDGAVVVGFALRNHGGTARALRYHVGGDLDLAGPQSGGSGAGLAAGAEGRRDRVRLRLPRGRWEEWHTVRIAGEADWIDAEGVTRTEPFRLDFHVQNRDPYPAPDLVADLVIDGHSLREDGGTAAAAVGSTLHLVPRIRNQGRIAVPAGTEIHAAVSLLGADHRARFRLPVDLPPSGRVRGGGQGGAAPGPDSPDDGDGAPRPGPSWTEVGGLEVVLECGMEELGATAEGSIEVGGTFEGAALPDRDSTNDARDFTLEVDGIEDCSAPSDEIEAIEVAEVVRTPAPDELAGPEGDAGARRGDASGDGEPPTTEGPAHTDEATRRGEPVQERIVNSFDDPVLAGYQG